MSQVRLAERMFSMSESATLALNARAKQLAAEGRTIYNLTAGELATDTPAYIQDAVAKELSKNKYTPVAGLPELREAIATNARQYYGLDWIQAENVVVTGGAKPALYTSFLALLDPGDEVIMPTPTWVSYNDLIKLVGGTVVGVPMTEAYDLDVAAIKAALTPKTKLIVLNSPHNPTGTVFSKAALQELAAALEGSRVIVIADDIYTKLIYTDDFTLTATCGFESLVIINGFSKSQALTGWRIGYLIAETTVAKAVTDLLSHMTGNAPLPSQYAALAAMERGDQPPQTTLDALRRQRGLVSQGLTGAGIPHTVPGGAFYIFMDVRALTDNSAEWCERLLVEAGVALVPGEAFSAPGFVRLTFVADEATLRGAVDQIKQFMENN